MNKVLKTLFYRDFLTSEQIYTQLFKTKKVNEI